MQPLETDDVAPSLPQPSSDPNAVEGAPGGRTGGQRSLFGNLRSRSLPFALIGCLVLVLAGFSIGMPDQFGTWGNYQDIISTEVLLLALTIAVAFPLRAGDFDLSMANNMVLVGVVVVELTTKTHMGGVLALVIGLLVGLFIGVFNGLAVVFMRMNAFMITLATMMIVGAIGMGVTSSAVVSVSNTTVLNFARAQFLGLPAAAWYTWGIALVAWYVFEFTPYGRKLLFAGGNRDAARLAGVNVGLVRCAAFAICGLIAGFAGLLMAGTQGAVDPTSGSQFLLQPYAAVFLGTTALQLGRINIIGSVVSLYFLAAGVTGLELLGVASWISDVFNGVALLIALLIIRFGGFAAE